LTGILVLCGLVLVPGQTATALAVEALLLFAVLIADVVRTVRSFEGPGEKIDRAVAVRTAVALALLALGALGSVGLFFGWSWAMSQIGFSTLLGLPPRLIQAWALLVAALQVQDHAEPPVARGAQ
jgi:hypothetical protein